MTDTIADIAGMQLVFDRPHCLKDAPFTYCPGCGHGVVHRLLAETIDELGIQDRTIGMASIGCSVFNYKNFDVDMLSCPHGRAPACGTAVKRVHPEAFVFIYQGDGDLASIGAAEILHAAARGEKITVIFVNNANYGMTGGQMAPTTLVGMKTTTSPRGRDSGHAGSPLRVVEMLAGLPGVAYAARGAVHDPRWIHKTKGFIKKAAQCQLDGRGFSIVEILSNCNMNWRMDPEDANRWIESDMVPEFPLGVVKE